AADTGRGITTRADASHARRHRRGDADRRSAVRAPAARAVHRRRDEWHRDVPEHAAKRAAHRAGHRDEPRAIHRAAVALMQRGLPDPSVVTRRRESGEHLALECDLCVVGSGAAGAAAAIEAGRLGLDVVLVDGAPQVGGQATGAIIDTFCGFYSVGPQPELLTFGIAE